MDFVERNWAEQYIVASEARLFGDDTKLPAILTIIDLREQNVFAAKCATLTTMYGYMVENPSYYEVTLRNSPNLRG